MPRLPARRRRLTSRNNITARRTRRSACAIPRWRAWWRASRALREAVRRAKLISGAALHPVHVYEPPRLPEKIAAHVPGAEGEVQDSGVRYTRDVSPARWR